MDLGETNKCVAVIAPVSILPEVIVLAAIRSPETYPVSLVALKVSNLESGIVPEIFPEATTGPVNVIPDPEPTILLLELPKAKLPSEFIIAPVPDIIEPDTAGFEPTFTVPVSRTLEDRVPEKVAAPPAATLN